jgi:hypothetical protein
VAEQAEQVVREPNREHWTPLNWKEQWKVFLLAGILSVEIIGSGIVLVRLVHSPSGDDRLRLSEILFQVGIAGLLGGAARALLFLKTELGGHGAYRPQWYLDKWPLYLAKPFLGVAGALAFWLAGRVGFSESFDTDTVADHARTLLTALAGGMFFEGAFERLKDLIAEPRSPAAGTPRPIDGSHG